MDRAESKAGGPLCASRFAERRQRREIANALIAPFGVRPALGVGLGGQAKARIEQAAGKIGGARGDDQLGLPSRQGETVPPDGHLRQHDFNAGDAALVRKDDFSGAAGFGAALERWAVFCLDDEVKRRHGASLGNVDAHAERFADAMHDAGGKGAPGRFVNQPREAVARLGFAAGGKAKGAKGCDFRRCADFGAFARDVMPDAGQSRCARERIDLSGARGRARAICLRRKSASRAAALRERRRA